MNEMKYYVIYVVNGSLQISKITEWTDLDKAKAAFHDVCKLMWATADVETASVRLIDSQLDTVENYKEFVDHRPAPEPNAANE